MKEQLNGSVERLAAALRDVVKEGVAEAVEPLRGEIAEVRTEMRDMESRLNVRIDGVESGLKTTNENIQAQLAQHRSDVAGDVRRIIREERIGTG